MIGMEAAERDVSGPAGYLGVPSAWMFVPLVPALVATLLTQTLFWGLVGLLGALVIVFAGTALRGTVPLRERSWFGLPAFAVWVATAAAVSGGAPSDAHLFSSDVLGLAGVVLALDALLRGNLR
jgi:hypothetical protein